MNFFFKSLIGLLLWLLFLGLALPVTAQAPFDAEVDFYRVEAPPEAGAEAEEPRPLTVGDRIKLRLEVTHPAGSQVAMPRLAPEWGAFEVLEQGEPETIDNDDGSATTGQDLIVTVFEPGRFQTPPLVVEHRKPDGAVEELAAPVVQLRVSSVLTEALALRDLKPQAELPLPPLWPWVVGGLLATFLLTGLLAGLGLILYHRLRRGADLPEVAVPFVDPRPPEVIAHAELNRIEALNLPAQNQIKEHYSLVDVCLRRYIEGRYDIPALEQTTGEIRAAFRAHASRTTVRAVSSFISIFGESDLVKFARYRPPAEEVDQLIDRARAVVDQTTSHPAPVAAVESTPEGPVR